MARSKNHGGGIHESPLSRLGRRAGARRRHRRGRVPADHPAHQRLPLPVRADQRIRLDLRAPRTTRPANASAAPAAWSPRSRRPRRATTTGFSSTAATSSRARCSTPTTRASAAAEMMNKLGYDAMTVGNHEFDDGPEVLRELRRRGRLPDPDVERRHLGQEPLLVGRDPALHGDRERRREDRPDRPHARRTPTSWRSPGPTSCSPTRSPRCRWPRSMR